MLGPRNSVKQEQGNNGSGAVLPLAACLAKTITEPDGRIAPGIGVLGHCCIVGLVARNLIRREPQWLSSTLFPEGSELLVALHDIGKVSPGFQEKLTRAIDPEKIPTGRQSGLCRAGLDAAIGGHGAVGQAVMRGRGRYYAEIIGRHHGFTPNQTGLPTDEKYGGAAWQQTREELINTVQQHLNVQWPDIQNEHQADALTGLTCVADWIASGPQFDRADLNDPALEQLISTALDNAGFIAPRLVKGLTFEQVFDFQPRPAQTTFIEVATGLGAYVLEAPMGLGKTEAALYAAYQVMEQNKATGIYFALPTQLTSDKVFVRMNRFLEQILASDCVHRTSLLLHGSAWLKKSDMGGEGQPGKSWFDSRKRGLLAPFAVGTIDQALMAAMNVKHGFVRTFGLAGKVVILDEVHSYDSYTGTILDRLVAILRELNCTVIILSATLTAERRAALMDTDRATALADYPLVSARPKVGEPREYPVEKGPDMAIELGLEAGDEATLEDALDRASQGEQVLWIENTVADAQRLYQRLAGRASSFADCGLIHSRFLKKDRWRKEDTWVGIYGKGGGEQRALRGRIMVGTQVLEQSLDIDADFLVTRICPMDMLFQRIGRLWRHRGNDPFRPASTKPRVTVLAPALAEALEDVKALGKTAKVYSPYVLCRTLEVLQNMGSDVVYVPGSIRHLLEAVYAERDEHGPWTGYRHELDQGREKLCRLALVGVSRGGVTLPESKAATRYSDTASAETLLIQSLERHSRGATVRLLDGSALDLPTAPGTRQTKAWREAAATLQQNTVHVPAYLAPACPVGQMDWLKEYVWLGEDDESPFRVALVLPSGELTGLGHQSAHIEYDLRYNDDVGYKASRR